MAAATESAGMRRMGGENSAVSTEPAAVKAKCVLLDIEGTICPISFVKDTLFPYALNALPTVLANHWNSPHFTPYRDAFPPEHRQTPETLQAYVKELTAADRKDACLKNLQGYLWENGYETEAYATPLFKDVAPALKAWREQGVVLAIYSSGSVFAQRLLFGHVKVEGEGTEDLQWLITDWFDTVNAGPKKETASYQTIAQALKLSPEDILFLTDSVEEYDASTVAGFKAGLLVRPGNPALKKEDADRCSTMESLKGLKMITA